MSFMDDFLLGCAGTDSFYPVSTTHSCRLDPARSCYLYLTFGTPTANTTWSFSALVKKCAFATQSILTATGGTGIALVNDVLVFRNAGSTVATSTALLRDPTQHGHLFVVSNGTTVVAYWNGVQVLSYTGTLPLLNSAVTHNIGRNTAGSEHFDGYMSDVHFVDGTALTASSFGQASPLNSNVWVPRAYGGSYGTNGFLLEFGNAAALGTDTSGNGNNWTSSGLASTDQMTDTPTNNYCTLNPLYRGTTYSAASTTLSEGNTKVVHGTWGAPYPAGIGSFAPVSGKWYFEYTPSNVGTEHYIGVSSPEGSVSPAAVYRASDGWYYDTTAGVYVAYGSAYTTGVVVGVAWDADTGQITFYRNNVSQGAKTFSAMAGKGLSPFASGYPSGAAGVFNFGATAFAYTPPTGFKALCSANLPYPAIVDSTKYMDAKLYSGTGSAQNITSFNFQPDLSWIKSRSNSYGHRLVDSVRGATHEIASNDTSADAVQAQGLTAFLSNGFSLGTDNAYNGNGYSQVAWCWKKDAKAGFDIVGYTGTGVAGRTVAHSLGVVPEMIIFKDRTSSSWNWPVWHKGLSGITYAVWLNLTYEQTVVADYLNSTTPTSSLFTLGNSSSVNADGDNYVAYLFASIEGFSKFGSYVGNGNADGPFVYCGFRPRWLLVKNVTTASTGWAVWDAARNTYNVMGYILEPDSAGAEQGPGYNIDFTSNGFKIRFDGTYSFINKSADTFIFAAFAEAPFKYANAR